MNNSELGKVQPLQLPETAAGTHTIFISDLLLDMMIGVYEHEKDASQPVRINITMTVKDHLGPINDDYHNVVCYESIANAVKEMVERQHINLVETLAENIADICLAHTRIVEAKVKVEKLTAVTNAGSVGVEIVRKKKE
ncbi:dihydroneopterin aldolase [Sneathiella chinensis]|uniref:7,8-dihydroneopterin aldolase n=1 Tax=Sneathiella chinensis TaxID=349750 RepID=A0ABQ5U4P2_9PROT|nr:dihydroneopterin aldolase [Sneathiella chinensis]GLQ06249.1 diguanylate cyclase [Sneathiella chinensis]